MEIDIATSLSNMVLATGAVGVAAMGITEGFKSVKVTPMGFNKLEEEINWATDALKISYGDDYRKMIMSLYRNGRRKGDLPRVLRQGVRIGMDENTAKTMANVVGGVSPERLSEVAAKLKSGEELNPIQRNILGRFEVAADARIDAAFSLAERAYANIIRYRASQVALALSISAAIALDRSASGFLTAIIVGLTAVPIAPIAKDVAKGFQSATKAIGARK